MIVIQVRVLGIEHPRERPDRWHPPYDRINLAVHLTGSKKNEFPNRLTISPEARKARDFVAAQHGATVSLAWVQQSVLVDDMPLPDPIPTRVHATAPEIVLPPHLLQLARWCAGRCSREYLSEAIALGLSERRPRTIALARGQASAVAVHLRAEGYILSIGLDLERGHRATTDRPGVEVSVGGGLHLNRVSTTTRNYCTRSSRSIEATRRANRRGHQKRIQEADCHILLKRCTEPY